ncbi:hypothetical protein [Aeromicrobium sp. HA]|uniref:hypothetical protein n=1 Tax=Aeromicrobium sp. HA TaxID=3009077 RepID=UPI0022AEB36B|nr:hypothetical protein [Aeromicrobium sp. HA]
MSHYHRKCPTPGCPGDPNFTPPWGHHGRDCHRTRIPARLVDWLIAALLVVTFTTSVVLGLWNILEGIAS